MAAASTPVAQAEITLFGATGYTGRQIARALARDGLSFRIAGRSAGRLAALSGQLPNQPEWLAADAANAASLAPLFKGTRLLINCAGPFTDLGERVIAQAALSGTHYLDITNELGFLYRARGYHQMALKTGAALVPACGFEVALADCLAQLAGAALAPTPHNPLESIDVVYVLSGASSRGTRRSAVRSLATSWIAYRNGEWIGQVPGGRVRRFDLPDGALHALSFPSCESITVPAHLPVRRVDVWMRTPAAARFFAPVAIPLLARLSRSILRGTILSIAARSGVTSSEPATALASDDAPFTVYARATGPATSATAADAGTTHWLALQGLGPYPLTAEIIAYYARQMTQPGYDRRGLLAPAQAVDPQTLLDYAQKMWGLTLVSGEGQQ